MCIHVQYLVAPRPAAVAWRVQSASLDGVSDLPWEASLTGRPGFPGAPPAFT